MAQATQFFIEGDLVTCTVFNDTGLGFYSSETAKNTDINVLAEAMATALASAEDTKEKFTAKTEASL